MKVLYSVSMMKDWVDVAQYFYRTKGWEPTLWQTTEVNRQYFKSKFPNSNTIDFFDSNKGNFETIKLEKKIFLSKELLNKYLKYEKITIKMMDRMDPDRYSFNYSERVQLYYNLLEFIVNYLSSQKPDLVIFHETPHFPFQYLLYAVSLENNINILRFSPTHLNGRTFLTSTLEAKPFLFQESYAIIEENNISNLDVETYFEKIHNNYNAALPYYMNKVYNTKNQSSSYKMLRAFKRSIRYLYIQNPYSKYFKEKNKNVREEYTKIDYSFSSFFATFYKIKLQNEYEKYVRLTLNNFDLNNKFIYFALHYQPEKTTSPEGGVFVDQFLAISLLSKVSRGRFKVYVKEHVSQFSHLHKGEQGRQIDFYKELALLDHVVFVDTNINSFELIDSSIAVSTITGTVGFESVVRGKPSIIFGYPWYKECSGVFLVSCQESLEEVIDKVFNSYHINLDKIKYFLQTIFNLSEEIYVDMPELKRISSNENNKKSIILLLEKYFYTER